MPTIKIPAKMMLAIVLENLNLPEATYRNHKNYHDELFATVSFYPLLDRIGRYPGKVTLKGNPASDMEEAEESAAVEGIRYMEICQKVEIHDYNYARLQMVKDQKNSILQNLKDKKENGKALCKGWDSTLQCMEAICSQLQEIPQDNFTPGSSSSDIDLKRALLHVEDITEELDHLYIQCEEYVQTIGTYPYNDESDFNEDESLHAYDYNDLFAQSSGTSMLDDESIYNDSD